MKTPLSLLFFLFITIQIFSQKSIPFAYAYDAEEFIARGLELHDSSKYVEAVREYNKVDPEDPKYLQAMYEKFISLQAQDKEDDIILEAKVLSRKYDFSTMPKLFIIYASILDDKEQYATADSLFQVASKYLPNSGNLYLNHAISKIRQKKNQDAIELLKKTIEIDPDNVSAIYFLGLLAFENGMLSEGCLAMITTLALNPTHKNAHQAIVNLNAKMAQNYNGKKVNTFSANGDDFSELEEILRNQLPLNKKYQLRCEIDDVFTRNVQAICDYAKSHKVQSGFFEQKFIPYLAELPKRNLTEAFQYFILSSLEGDLSKVIKKHEKDVTLLFKNYFKQDFWEIYSKRKNIYGYNGEVNVLYDGIYPNLIGKVVQGKKQGLFYQINSDGFLKYKIQYKDNMLQGLTTEFNKEGNIIEEVNYVNDEKHGENKKYYSNGQLAYRQTFLNGKSNGDYIVYYPTGTKKIEGTFKSGEVDKILTFYNQDGTVLSKKTFKDGKLQGNSTFYTENGDIQSIYNYVNDEPDGECIEYYDGKIIKSKINYKAGKVHGNKIIYYPNGKIQSESKIDPIKQTRVETEYDILGRKSDEYFYDKNDNLKKISSIDPDGNISFEQEFTDDGELKIIKQYLASSDKPIDIKTSKGKYTLKNRNGIPFAEGSFYKSKRDKEWIRYYENGAILSKVNFSKGSENGLSQIFNKNGELIEIMNYTNGKLNGEYFSYKNEKIDSRYLYYNGETNGPFTTYEDGHVLKKGLYNHGEIVYRITFAPNGDTTLLEHFLDGIPSSTRFYQNGKLSSTLNHHNKNGEVINIIGPCQSLSSQYKNGVLHGKQQTLNKSGSPSLVLNYINNVLHGNYYSYYPSGNKYQEGFYYSGQLNGLNTFNDHNNVLWGKQSFFFGRKLGITFRYYQNGKVYTEHNQEGENYQGPAKYYNQEGELVATLLYHNDFITGYSYLQNGVMSKLIQVDTQRVHVVSKYNDGKIACEFTINKMLLQDKLIIKSKGGQLNIEVGYKNGDLHGLRKLYYQSGKLYKSESYKNGYDDGDFEYFSENGNLLIKFKSKADELQGDYQIYKNGVPIIINKFNYGVPISCEIK